jgi:hypothetical protein
MQPTVPRLLLAVASPLLLSDDTEAGTRGGHPRSPNTDRVAAAQPQAAGAGPSTGGDERILDRTRWCNGNVRPGTTGLERADLSVPDCRERTRRSLRGREGAPAQRHRRRTGVASGRGHRWLQVADERGGGSGKGSRSRRWRDELDHGRGVPRGRTEPSAHHDHAARREAYSLALCARRMLRQGDAQVLRLHPCNAWMAEMPLRPDLLMLSLPQAALSSFESDLMGSRADMRSAASPDVRP